MPFISVILPTYNRNVLLDRAIESVLSQTFTDYELIVVDDGSTDGTERLVRLSSSKVLYTRLDENGGVSRARNRGVRSSLGTWIAFLDSDDQWHRDKLREQVSWIHQNPSFKIVQSKEIWIRNGKKVNPPATHIKFQGDLFRASLERCMITPSSVMLTRELFEESGGFNESLPACEDYDLWLRITCRYPVGLVDKFHLQRFGGHGDQLSSTVMGLDRYRIRALLGLLMSGILDEQQRVLAQKNLIYRAQIVAQGYLKRGNRELYERFNAIAEQYRTGRC